MYYIWITAVFSWPKGLWVLVLALHNFATPSARFFGTKAIEDLESAKSVLTNYCITV